MAWEPVMPEKIPGESLPEWVYDKLTEEEIIELRICMAARFEGGYKWAIARMKNGEF